MIFKTSLGRSSIIITIVTTVLFAFLIVLQYSFIKNTTGHISPIYTTVGCLAIYFLSFAFSPKEYIVTDDEITIVRPLINAHIKRCDIISVEQLDPSQIKLSLRTFGVGGIFGYYGNFVNPSLGRMTWYITRKDKLILLRTKENQKIILSPDESEQFIQALAN